jgi:NADH-quinone oxidoreductase subunit E
MPIGNQTSTSASPKDTEILAQILADYGFENSLMIYLQQVQSEFGYVPEFAIRYISEHTRYSASHIYGIITFYSQFSTKPVGKNIVKLCSGTACHVGGSKVLQKKLRSNLKLGEDDDTTDDMIFTVQEVACLGCCALAPAMMVNDKAYGKLDSIQINRIIDGYRHAAQIEDE